MTLTWVIGAGGLLGSAIARSAGEVFAPRITWSDPDRACADIEASARAFRVRAGDGPWGIAWAAGAATTASSQRDVDAELATFVRAVASVAENLPAGPGSVLVASSAGGIYAGASSPPFTDATPPAPVSPYGRLKLAQEEAAEAALGQRCPVVLARIANLYGPGQDLAKLQGIVSRLALSLVTREPVNVFVPLDTLRDYIAADDAGAIATWWIEEARQYRASGPVVIASGRPMSLGEVLSTVNTVAGRRVPVAFGAHASAASQARDLRLEPTRASDTGPLIRTTFPAGVRATLDDVRTRHRGAVFTA